MESYEVIKQAVEVAGAKKLASDIGVSHSLVYKWCEEPKAKAGDDGSGTLNPLDRVAALWDATRDPRLIDWLCRRAGGTFVPDPFQDRNIDAEYVERTQRMVQEFSQVLDAVSQAMLNDGRVDRGEAQQIRERWQTLKQHTEGFVLACERGAYDRPEIPGTTRHPANGSLIRPAIAGRISVTPEPRAERPEVRRR